MPSHKQLLSALAVLACLAPAAFAAGLGGSQFEGVSVTGSIQVERGGARFPINFWDVSDPAIGANTFFDPAWLNFALNSTTVPITDDAIEFGFGRIAGVWSAVAAHSKNMAAASCPRFCLC